jgi:hypothetical protein
MSSLTLLPLMYTSSPRNFPNPNSSRSCERSYGGCSPKKTWPHLAGKEMVHMISSYNVSLTIEDTPNLSDSFQFGEYVYKSLLENRNTQVYYS